MENTGCYSISAVSEVLVEDFMEHLLLPKEVSAEPARNIGIKTRTGHLSADAVT
jgi:hypothetical protein